MFTFTLSARLRLIACCLSLVTGFLFVEPTEGRAAEIDVTSIQNGLLTRVDVTGYFQSTHVDISESMVDRSNYGRIDRQRVVSIFVENLLTNATESRQFSVFGSVEINVELGDGDDQVNNATDIPVVVRSGRGNDSVQSGGGNDEIYTGAGDDYIVAGGGDDTIFSGSGDDQVYADGQYVQYRDGWVYGITLHQEQPPLATGNDYVFSGPGNDLVNAGPGHDTVYGGSGKDHLDGLDGDDYLDGGDGEDYLVGSDGQDELHGGEDADVLLGGDDRDSLAGGEGWDFLDGQQHSDYLIADWSDELFEVPFFQRTAAMLGGRLIEQGRYKGYVMIEEFWTVKVNQ